jgi:predicted RecB family nuclease
MLEKSGRKVKAHIIYQNKEGQRIPGTTTVINVLSKPNLVPWANRLGLQGIDVKDFVDDKADIGTLVHEMMFADLKEEKVDTSYYTGQQIEIAQNSFKKYLDWKKKHTIVPLLLEKALVSEKHQYGGTIDNYCKLDSVYTLIDYKTSKAIWSEYYIQVSAYRQLLKENGYKVKQVAILRVGRSEDEGFEFQICSGLDKYFKVFKHCLAIYNLQKKLK